MDVNLKFNKPEVQITLDRMKIKDLGLSSQDVIAAMQSAFSGGRLAYFIHEWLSVPVIAQVERTDRNKPMDIHRLYVRNNKGQNIPLSAVVKLEKAAALLPCTILTGTRLLLFRLLWQRGKPLGMV